MIPTSAVYDLVLPLRRCDVETPALELPSSGIYIFFERGEVAEHHGQIVDRIVRVGTHTRDGNFRQRIRQHYGHVRSFNGSKNGSVFRKHVGGALLRRNDPNDPRLTEWLRQMGRSYSEVEEAASRHLRNTFTFVCFSVDRVDHRMELERGLIAQLAQHPLSGPSASWLGHHSAADKIRRSGLWNTQRVDATVLANAELMLLERLVRVGSLAPEVL